MSIFNLFEKQSSANIAKERLMMVLSYERKGLPSNFADILKNDLIAIFSKYPQFDSDNIEVEIKSEDYRDELWISIPFANGK
ncbi:cell division topological specificity factor MinE [Sulfurihydrogenibium sp.]|jgi:cell division topological specificity factor|uniref:cell division topological specificity factor MinE n=1 Tax=Sulfurihydrogenibium sp. TaxID=2053621 RepID=UPI0026305393|nr:cell division topological specificity factor MinE [Sulfurihydrogenibium sp.]